MKTRVVLAALAIAMSACGGTTVIARCKSGVQFVSKRVGHNGNANLIVCKDGTVYKVDP